MKPLDASFIDCFLGFLNDATANARRVEKPCGAHPYIARLGLFKVDLGTTHYRPLRESMQTRLTEFLKKGIGDIGRRELAKALNRLQFDGLLLVETATGEKVAVPKRIGAMVEYVVERRRVVPRIYPTISGMEGFCEYALMLIQTEPSRVRICPWAGCGKFFNTQTSGQRGFCSKIHAENAEGENKKVRTWNSRHRENKKPMPYRTTRPKLRVRESEG